MGDLVDYLSTIPPEWIVVGWCGVMFVCLGGLLIVLVWATRVDPGYKGTRRVDRADGAEPYVAPGHFSRLRAAPYVKAVATVEGLGYQPGRHREEPAGPTRDLRNPRRPVRRETI